MVTRASHFGHHFLPVAKSVVCQGTGLFTIAHMASALLQVNSLGDVVELEVWGTIGVLLGQLG